MDIIKDFDLTKLAEEVSIWILMKLNMTSYIEDGDVMVKEDKKWHMEKRCRLKRQQILGGGGGGDPDITREGFYVKEIKNSMAGIDGSHTENETNKGHEPINSNSLGSAHELEGVKSLVMVLSIGTKDHSRFAELFSTKKQNTHNRFVTRLSFLEPFGSGSKLFTQDYTKKNFVRNYIDVDMIDMLFFIWMFSCITCLITPLYITH
ncbi:hypothetical protein ACJX0J_015556 [Zea mays]